MADTQTGDFIMKWGRWAGPKYSAGAFMEGRTWSEETSLVREGYFSDAPQYQPVNFIDAAARIHDLAYWHAEDRFATGLQREFSVSSLSGLSAEQLGSTAFAEFRRAETFAKYEADVVLIRNALAYRPINLFGQAYRDMLLQAFTLKASLTSGKQEAFEALWESELRHIDAGFRRATVGGVLGGIFSAAYWMYTGLQQRNRPANNTYQHMAKLRRISEGARGSAAGSRDRVPWRRAGV